MFNIFELKQCDQISRHKRSMTDPLEEVDQTPDQNFYDLFVAQNVFNQPNSPGNLSISTAPKNVEYQSEHLSSSSSKIHMREQYINEINQDGDFLLQQCFEQQMNDESTDILQAINPQNMLRIDNSSPTMRSSGTLKFFDESKKYGFIIMDTDGSDIFVHQDDLTKSGLTKDFLRTAKHGNTIRYINDIHFPRVSFLALGYFGKYQKSRKAIDIQLISYSPVISKHKRSMSDDDFSTPKKIKNHPNNILHHSASNRYDQNFLNYFPNYATNYQFPNLQ